MVWVNKWRGTKTIPRPKKFYRAGTAPPVLKFQDPPPGVCCITTWLPPPPRFSTHPIEMTGYSQYILPIQISQSKIVFSHRIICFAPVKLLDNHYGLFFHIAWSASFRTLVLLCWTRLCMINVHWFTEADQWVYQSQCCSTIWVLKIYK